MSSEPLPCLSVSLSRFKYGIFQLCSCVCVCLWGAICKVNLLWSRYSRYSQALCAHANDYVNIAQTMYGDALQSLYINIVHIRACAPRGRRAPPSQSASRTAPDTLCKHTHTCTHSLTYTHICICLQYSSRAAGTVASRHTVNRVVLQSKTVCGICA